MSLEAYQQLEVADRERAGWRWDYKTIFSVSLFDATGHCQVYTGAPSWKIPASLQKTVSPS